MTSMSAADSRIADLPPGQLGELLVAVETAERATARAVALAGALAGSGESEKVEGLPLGLLLGCRGG